MARPTNTAGAGAAGTHTVAAEALDTGADEYLVKPCDGRELMARLRAAERLINLQEEPAGEYVRRETINDIYRQAAADSPEGYLYYTEKQNVSGDIIGMPRVAATIEGYETHSRTAEATIDLAKIPGLEIDLRSNPGGTVVRIPVTQAVIYGWYDNEMGSYVNMLGDRTVSIAELM